MTAVTSDDAALLAPAPPPLNGWTVCAALVWAVPLLYLDWTHVKWNGDVDTTGFVVAVVALAPAWVFIRRNVAIEAFGQKISVTTTEVDEALRKATGGAPGGGTGAWGSAAVALPNIPDGHPAQTPAPATIDAVADWLSDTADDMSTHDSAAPSELVNPALTHAASMLKSLAADVWNRGQSAAPQRTVVLVEPPSTGNPVLNLRNRIMSRLRALAAANGIDVGQTVSTMSLLKALGTTSVLTPAEREGIAFFVNVGNQAAHGAKAPPEIVQRVLDHEPALIASLDRKIASGHVDGE